MTLNPGGSILSREQLSQNLDESSIEGLATFESDRQHLEEKFDLWRPK